MQTKLSKIKEAFEAGDLRSALSMAAKFYDLGEQADAIKRGHEAYANPRFWKSLGYDLDVLIENGRLALIARWGFKERVV